MHQNEDYIDFANDNTVEVIAMGRLDEAVKKKAKKAAQYDAEDANGNPVKYMVEFPNLTLDEMIALRGSKAGTYNDTGGIPYLAIVDPHTEKRLFGSNQAASNKGRIMELVEKYQKQLEKEYGEKLSREDLNDVNEAGAEALALAKEKGAGKGLSAFAKDYKKLSKKAPEKLVEKLDAFKEQLIEMATSELDDAESLIDDGDFSAAKKVLASLKSALKKHELADRVTELYAKIKEAQAAAE